MVKIQKGKALENHKLYYEDLERKPVKTAKNTTKKTVKTPVKKQSKKTLDLAKRFEDAKKSVRGFLNNTKKKVVSYRKKAQKLTKMQKKELRQRKLHGIIGIGLLFVIVSIAYSTYMTNLFVDGVMMIVALTPQVAFAAITLFIAFYKLYK